jgi:hypothetical protein
LPAGYFLTDPKVIYKFLRDNLVLYIFFKYIKKALKRQKKKKLNEKLKGLLRNFLFSKEYNYFIDLKIKKIKGCIKEYFSIFIIVFLLYFIWIRGKLVFL